MKYTSKLKDSNHLSLISKFYSAAENSKLWDEALISLAKTFDAKAAIITLRDKKTCEVIISNEIETEFHTPFVAALNKKHIEDYVQNYRFDDIWAHQQKLTHPHIPILMSKYVSRSKLTQSKFWNWLKNAEINDTIVAEIGSSPHYWTALNIYFENDDEAEANDKLSLLKLMLPDIKRAWSLGLCKLRMKSLREQMIEHVKNHPQAVFLVDEANKVVDQSKSARVHLSSGMIEICARTKTLSIAKNISHKSSDMIDRSILDKPPHEKADLYKLCFEHSKKGLLSTGEAIGLRTIIIQNKLPPNILPWEHPSLDERTKKLLLLIAKGNTIKSAASSIGISQRYAGTIWRNTRKLLNGINKSDLIFKYQNNLT